MGKTPTQPTAPKQPKTVRMSTHIQTVVIAVLATGIIVGIASSFMTLNAYSLVHQAVAKDFTAVASKEIK